MKAIFHSLLALSMGMVGCTKPDIPPIYITDFDSGKEILAQYGPKEQIFTGDAEIIESANGCFYRLYGPFISLSNGETLNGDITVHLTEYMDKKEMMLANVQTLSYGLPYNPAGEVSYRLLSSTGAFRISVTIDNEPVIPNKVEFFLPTNAPNEDMQLFFGSSSDSSFIWNPIVNGDAAPTAGLFVTSASELGGFGNLGYAGFVNLNEYFMDGGAVFINCDYFLSSEIPVTNILVRPILSAATSSGTISMSILFQTENAILTGYWITSEQAFQFSNVPKGFDVNCFSIGVSSNQEIMLGMMNFTISDDGIYSIDMNPVTEEQLVGTLEGL